MSGVLYSAAHGVATLTLDEEDNKNALNASILNGIGAGLDQANADPSVRVIVLTNNGTTFCAGADLKAATAGQAAVTSFPDVLNKIIESPKPVIGKINGHCMGGGVGLAAVCDISIAVEDVRLGFTEVRIGVAPAMISVVCLPKLSKADAADLFLSGRKFTASHAAKVGLINRAVPASDLDAATEELVGEVAAGGPLALAAAKELLAKVPGMDLAEAFSWTSQLSGELFRSAEASEGIGAFRERRPAAWVPERT